MSLPVVLESHRILHIHRNIPGIINEINKVLADKNINVDGQYLRTLGDIGYVVMDVQAASNEDTLDLLSKLKQIDATIRARHLI